MIIGNSGYEVKQTYCYSGRTSNHCKYSVFPAGDEPEWYSTTHGMRPRYTNQIAYFSWRSSRWYRSTHNAVITGIDGVIYNVWVEQDKSLHWVAYSSMSILEVHADLAVEPDTTEFVVVDITNIGGAGSYDLILLDNTIELDKVSNVSISANVSARKTLSFIMLDHVMTLTIKLIDKRTGDIVDERIRTISLPDPCENIICDPECIGVDKYETVCKDGICVRDLLIEVDSSYCGYTPPDPCKDVICDPECFDGDIHATECEDGVCIKGVLIKDNSPDCPGYVPPSPICNDGELRGVTICKDGSTIYAEICQNNKWVSTGQRCPEDPEPDLQDKWLNYVLIGIAVILFYLLARRG